MLSLTVERREGAKNEAIRKAGKIPAVFYGPKEASTSIAVSAVEFKKVWKKAGESSVVVLKEGTNEHEALIHDVDIHPVSGIVRHADFYVIEKGKKVKVRTPIVYEGTSVAVKDKGGILIKVLRDIEIEAAPKDLPHEIVVDISPLVELNSAIHASDIKLPAGVTLVTRADEIVASIAVAKEEVEEAPQAIDMSTIEVAAKGKEVKEGEAAPAEEGDKKSAPAKDEKKAEKK
ncbi:MAG: 50S ribosomal protein L25 [Candidatus Pacebacteria bacterium]|nr:50S ribosomal protein L25 [Candidatus Paceibacterota bacterium]